MNKKICMTIAALLVSILCICVGCSTKAGEEYTIEDLDNLAEIKIISGFFI